MTNAFLWHMLGVDRAAMIGMARTIILWDKTVIVVDGSKPDFEIQVQAHATRIIAYNSALIETKEAEERGLAVKGIYGLRGLGGDFAMNVTAAHRLFAQGAEKRLEAVVSDIAFLIQRDGEDLYG